MKNLKLEQIKSIALELGITLSYKDEEGKRKRYTKEELIAKIEEFEKEESKEINAIQHSELENSSNQKYSIINKLRKDFSYGMIGEILKDEKLNSELILEQTINNNPVLTVKSYLKENKLEKVQSILNKLIELCNDKKVKSIQRSNYKKYYNIITSMLKIKKVKLA